MLINKGEQIGQIPFKDLKPIRKMFIQILMLTVQKKYKILIVLEDTITDVPIDTKLLIHGRKLNICRSFIKQSYFAI